MWTSLGLKTYYILFLIDLKTRKAHLAGITMNPDDAFMAQVARNLIDPIDGFIPEDALELCGELRVAIADQESVRPESTR